MASRSIFVFTILFSLVLVSCRPSMSSNIDNRMINRVCRKTKDLGFCVSTLMSYQSSANGNPKALAEILANQALSKVDEGNAYIEKVVYYQDDMVVREYLALCLDDYARAGKKLKQVVATLASGGYYKNAGKLLRGVARLAADCQESFERKKLQSEVNYKPPRPSPLSQQNKSIRVMALSAARLLA